MLLKSWAIPPARVLDSLHLLGLPELLFDLFSFGHFLFQLLVCLPQLGGSLTDPEFKFVMGLLQGLFGSLTGGDIRRKGTVVFLTVKNHIVGANLHRVHAAVLCTMERLEGG